MKKRFLLELVHNYKEREKGFDSYMYVTGKRIGLDDNKTVRVYRYKGDVTIKEKRTFTKLGARRVYNKWVKEYNTLNPKDSRWPYAYDIMGFRERFITHLSLGVFK